MASGDDAQAALLLAEIQRRAQQRAVIEAWLLSMETRDSDG